MTVLINQEIISKIQSPLDIEKFGQCFKTENLYFTFPDPNLTTMDKNLYYLLRNSQEIKFDKQYQYRPDYLSYDQYGTTILKELLMYVNGIFSVEDFDLDKVVIPTLDAIIFILQDAYPNLNSDNIQTISW